MFCRRKQRKSCFFLKFLIKSSILGCCDNSVKTFLGTGLAPNVQASPWILMLPFLFRRGYFWNCATFSWKYLPFGVHYSQCYLHCLWCIWSKRTRGNLVFQERWFKYLYGVETERKIIVFTPNGIFRRVHTCFLWVSPFYLLLSGLQYIYSSLHLLLWRNFSSLENLWKLSPLFIYVIAVPYDATFPGPLFYWWICKAQEGVIADLSCKDSFFFSDNINSSNTLFF